MAAKAFGQFALLRVRVCLEGFFSKLHAKGNPRLAPRVITLLCLLVLCTAPLVAADKDEYKRIADSSFATVLRQSGATEEQEKWCLTSSPVCIKKNLWMDKTFGRIASESVESDLSSPRFHERGKTILEQLRPLDSAQVSIILASHVRQVSSGASSTLPKVEIRDANVILSYLIYHLVALHHAKDASVGGAGGGATLERAMIYEAIAQSYLIDAFSSGHMLVPMSDGLSFLHPMNNKQAHDFYNIQGTYVLNSRGEVWQTFGDELLEWYAPTFRHIFEACCKIGRAHV
jgi:hypothetical protein